MSHDVVQYAGSDFYTSEGASVAMLLINLQTIDESETTKKTVGGIMGGMSDCCKD